MSKTIEELANQYAEDMCPAQNYIDSVLANERNNDMAVCRDDAKCVLDWLFNKPLASRLTEAEKAMVRKEYADTYPNDVDRGIVNISKACLLVRIFGKEFFKEDKL